MNKIKNFSILSMLMFTALMFSGCADTTADDGTDTDTTPSSIYGTWTDGGCQVNGTASNDVSFLFADNQIVVTDSSYSDTACATVTKQSIATYTSLYSDTVTLASGDAANEMDLAGISEITTLYTSTLVDDYNLNNTDGFSDWAIGVAKDIPFTDTSTFYDIVSVLPSDSKLYFGDSSGVNDGSTAVLRPTQLDTTGISK